MSNNMVGYASFPSSRNEAPSNKAKTYHKTLNGLTPILLVPNDKTRSSLTFRNTSPNPIQYFYEMADTEKAMTILPMEAVNVSNVKSSLYLRSTVEGDVSEIEFDVAST